MAPAGGPGYGPGMRALIVAVCVLAVLLQGCAGAALRPAPEPVPVVVSGDLVALDATPVRRVHAGTVFKWIVFPFAISGAFVVDFVVWCAGGNRHGPMRFDCCDGVLRWTRR